MKSENKHKAIERDIGNITGYIGDVRKYLTLGHGFSGCNTNSAVYGHIKLSILKLLEKFKAAREKAGVFLQKNRKPETICESGIRTSSCFTVEKIKVHWLIWVI